MINTTTSLAVALLVGGLVPVAMAREERSFDDDQVKTFITYEGYSVDRVEEWGEYIRAILTDGSMVYFDPDTLRPVLQN